MTVPLPGRIIALVDHPQLDVLLMPVLHRLAERGHDARALVMGAGRRDRLLAGGIALCTGEDELQRFFAVPGPRAFLNGADMIPQHGVGIELDQACRLHGIPSLTLEHAPFALGYSGALPPHVEFAADVMAVIGKADHEQYLARGVAPERLVLTGSPTFEDLLAAKARRDPSAPPPRDIAIFGQAHTWIGARSPLQVPREQWISELQALYRLLTDHFPEATLRIKPHPAEPFHGTVYAYEAAVPDDLADRVEVLDTATDNGELILDSALVVSFSSSVWLEARLLERPAAFFSIQERTGSLRGDIAAMGGVWLALEGLDLTAKLAGRIDELKVQTGDPFPLPPALLQRYLGPVDRSASVLIADKVEDLMRHGAPDVPVPQLVFDAPNQPPRRLWPDRSYVDYVHLQTLADEVMRQQAGQPAVLALCDPGEGAGLGDHLPLAFLTRDETLPTAGERLPYDDDAFDTVVAPDLWPRVPLPEHAALLAELARVTSHRIVTSTPESAAKPVWQETSHLLDKVALPGPDLAAAPDTRTLEELHRALGLKLRTRSCHNPASWTQSIIIDNLGLDAPSLRAVHASLQAAGYPHEQRGTGMRLVLALEQDIAE